MISVQSSPLTDHLTGIRLVVDPVNIEARRPVRNLIVCVDNDNMSPDCFAFCLTQLPKLVADLLQYIDYREIYLVRNHPTLCQIFVEQDQVFRKFNMLRRRRSFGNANPLLTLCLEGIDVLKNAYERPTERPIDVVVVTQYFVHNEGWRDLMSRIRARSRLVYVSMDIMNRTLYSKIADGYKKDNIETFNLAHREDTVASVRNCLLVNLNLGTITVNLASIGEWNLCLTPEADDVIERVNYKEVVASFRRTGNLLVLFHENPRTDSYFGPISVTVDQEKTSRDIRYLPGVPCENLSNETFLGYYQMLVTYCSTVIEPKKEILDFVMDLENSQGHFKQVNGVNTELEYIRRCCLRERRLLRSKWLKDPVVEAQGESPLRMFNSYVEVAKSDIRDQRLSQKVRETIARRIRDIDERDLLDRITDATTCVGELDQNLDVLVESRSLFSSAMTLTDWYDEVSNGSALGLVIWLESNDLMKIAANGAVPKIQEITMTFMPVGDYVETAIASLKSDHATDIKDVRVVKGDTIGNGNVLLPLFICREHWRLAEMYVKYVLGIALANNPMAGTERHICLYYYVCSEMVRQTFSSPVSEKWLRLLCSMMRTCGQISRERRYHKGITRLVTNFVRDQERILVSRPFDNDVLFGQILGGDCGIERQLLGELCDRIYENAYFRGVCKSYTGAQIKDILEFIQKGLRDEDHGRVSQKLKEVRDTVQFSLVRCREMIAANFRMIVAMRSWYERVGGYDKYIGKLDGDYGVADQDVVDYLRGCVQEKVGGSDTREFYGLIGMGDRFEERMDEYTLRALMYPTVRRRRMAIKTGHLKVFDTGGDTVEYPNSGMMIPISKN